MIARLKSIPFMLFFIIYAFYVAYGVYSYTYLDDGEVAKHQSQMTTINTEIDGLKKKLAIGQKFLKSLEVKKADLQAQVHKLTEYQGALAEAPDVPNMIKTLISEAKQIELKVNKVEPGKKTQKEYYLEQEFKVEVRGTFHQIALFAQRISKLQRILRIESYAIKPAGTTLPSKNSVPLIGELSIRSYQYTLSKEDAIGKSTQKQNEKPATPPGGGPK